GPRSAPSPQVVSAPRWEGPWPWAMSRPVSRRSAPSSTSWCAARRCPPRSPRCPSFRTAIIGRCQPLPAKAADCNGATAGHSRNRNPSKDKAKDKKMSETKYTKDHEYVRLEGHVATVGITDYAQSQLGDVVYVGLPEIGKVVMLGGEAAVVESVKAA